MKKKITMISIFSLIALLILNGCSFGLSKFTVNFDKQDGSPIVTQSQIVQLNERKFVDEPEEPTKENYLFEGWYKEPECEVKWKFKEDTLKSGDNITLYANFIEESIINTSIGKFYRLQEAYDKELLTLGNLLDIAFYHDGSWPVEISRVPSPKNPTILSVETENKIKQTFIDDSGEDHTLEDVTIAKYCGTYNGAVVVYLEGIYDCTQASWSETVGGIKFKYNNGNHLLVWKEIEYNTIPFTVGSIINKIGTLNYEQTTIIDSLFSCIQPYDLLDGYDFLLNYNEEFFNDKALVVHIFNASTTSGSLEVKQLVKLDNQLFMDIIFLPGFDIALSYWVVVLEVNKIDIVDIEEVIIRDYKATLLDAKGHFFMTNFGGGLENFPYYLYGEYVPDVFFGATRNIMISNRKQVNDYFSETYTKSWSNEENDWVRDNRFTDIIDKYDNKFFQNKQLVTFFAEASSSGYHFELSKVIYGNGVVTIELDNINLSGGGWHIIVNWFGIVEIEKVPLDTEIVIKINNRNW